MDFICVFKCSHSYYITAIKIHLFFFSFTELCSQITLGELYPENGGEVLPRLHKFKYRPTRQLKNLRRVIGDDMFQFNGTSNLVERGHVIIGWVDRDIIYPLSNLFGEFPRVFDKTNNKFEQVDHDDLWRLGVKRRYSIVNSNDAAGARRVMDESNDEYEETITEIKRLAHREATKQANLQAAYQSHIQSRRRGSALENIQAIHQAYRQTYDRAYRDFLSSRGIH